MHYLLITILIFTVFSGCKSNKNNLSSDDSRVSQDNTVAVDNFSKHPKHIQEIAKIIAHIPSGSSIEEYQNVLKKTGYVVTPHSHFKDYEYYWEVRSPDSKSPPYIIAGAFANGLVYSSINLVEEAGGEWRTIWSMQQDPEKKFPLYIRVTKTLTCGELLKIIEHKISQGATSIRFLGGQWQWHDLTQLKLDPQENNDLSDLALKFSHDDFENSLSKWIASKKVKAVQIAFNKDLPAEAFFKVESILTNLKTPYVLMTGGAHNTGEVLFFQSDGKISNIIPKELFKAKIPAPDFLDDSDSWDF